MKVSTFAEDGMSTPMDLGAMEQSVIPGHVDQTQLQALAQRKVAKDQAWLVLSAFWLELGVHEVEFTLGAFVE